MKGNEMFDLFKRKKDQPDPVEGDPSMFAGFLEYFGEAPVLVDGATDPYDAFIDSLGGRSFGDGVFRVFERGDLERWHRVVSGCFTKLRGEFNLIGYDWMGRCFAVDQRDGDGKELVVLLEIATLDMYYIGKDVAVFLNEVMPNQSEACLEVGRYREWLEGHAPVGRMECVGYKVPLFLGGEDSLENMEVSDMEVYWDMTDQLWEAVKDLPEGTKIGNISFE